MLRNWRIALISWNRVSWNCDQKLVNVAGDILVLSSFKKLMSMVSEFSQVMQNRWYPMKKNHVLATRRAASALD